MCKALIVMFWFYSSVGVFEFYSNVARCSCRGSRYLYVSLWLVGNTLPKKHGTYGTRFFVIICKSKSFC